MGDIIDFNRTYIYIHIIIYIIDLPMKKYYCLLRIGSQFIISCSKMKGQSVSNKVQV